MNALDGRAQLCYTLWPEGKALTAIATQSSPWNLGMYLSPRANSALLSGRKRQTTLMQVSAASAIWRPWETLGHPGRDASADSECRAEALLQGGNQKRKNPTEGITPERGDLELKCVKCDGVEALSAKTS